MGTRSNLYKQFAERLKQIRKEENFTQRALAERIETSTRFLQKLESGENAPGFQTLELLAQATGRPVKDFFDFEALKENE